MKNEVIELKLNRQEAHALMRALGIAAESDRTVSEDKQPIQWIAQRLMPLVAASDSEVLAAEGRAK